jgi:hypothetical protein
MVMSWIEVTEVCLVKSWLRYTRGKLEVTCLRRLRYTLGKYEVTEVCPMWVKWDLGGYELALV